LLAFMGAMLGVVLSGNLVQLVVFWELTSLFSFLLIGYWHHRKDARRGARMALTVTGAGGLCLLAGMLLLGHIAGSYDLDVVLAAGERSAPPAVPAGAGAGAAGRVHQERAVPLPLLAAARHGGAHAGVGLPALGHHGQGRRVPAGAAVAGARRHRALVLDGRRRGPGHAAAGRYVAMFQHDLKGLLAYSTISHLGLITLLLG
jgi:multicomponent K+:H+ antiporter subunit A